MIKYLMVVLAISSIGCAAMKFKHPTKDPNTDYKKDWTNCRVKMNQAGVGEWHERDFLQDCMEGEGWERI